MRPVGLLILTALLAASVAFAQAPPAAPPGAPPGQPPAPPPPVPGGALTLADHLKGWEDTMMKTNNFRAEFTLGKTEATFLKTRHYTGSVLCMKPNMAILRLENAKDKFDYEAYVCNGKSVYEYNGLNKTITEFPLPANAGPGQSENLMIDFLSGMTAQAVQQRFGLSVFKEDANYVYLDIKPQLPKDKQEFEHVRFALLGPKVPPPHIPYLPAVVWMKKPNGDEEQWQFKGHMTNIPGVAPKDFQATTLPGFTYKRVPLGGAPAPGPAAPPKK